MEEKIDFDEWVLNYQLPEIRYYAKFDKNGSVIGLYPSVKELSDDFMIEIKLETALMIQEGKINLHSCYVDLEKKEFGILKTVLRNEAGPLHRIVESKYSKNKNFDIVLTAKGKKLTIEMAKKYGGTKTTTEKNRAQLKWSKETQLSFLVTAYNDPNILYENVKCTINELINSKFVIDLVDDVPDEFSVYTRKIFPNYVIIKK